MIIKREIQQWESKRLTFAQEYFDLIPYDLFTKVPTPYYNQ
jgi:hypothetical protein